MRTNFAIVTAALLVAGAPFPEAIQARATRPQLNSRWCDKAIVVDGSDAEWAGPLQQIDERQLVAVAAENDGQFLYLVLRTSDPAARMQILRQGLTVWFDPNGKDRKTFGINYPVGVEPADDGPSGGGGRPGGGGGRPGGSAGGSGGRQRPVPDGAGDALEPPNRLVMHGAKKDDARSLVADKVPGVELKIAETDGSLVYEMKIPLQKTSEFEYAIGAAPGGTISIGLEMPKAHRPSGSSFGGMGGGMPGGMSGRGRGGGGTGMPGRGGAGGPDREPPKPIKGWATVQLAKA